MVFYINIVNKIDELTTYILCEFIIKIFKFSDKNAN